MPTRRHLLGLAGATGAAAAAGCLDTFGGEAAGSEGNGDADGGDDADAESTPEPDADSGADDADEAPIAVRLGALSVQNNHAENHRVQLAVDADGDMRHLGTYDLEGEGASTRVEGAWTDEAGAYRVHAKLDDGEVLTEDVTEGIGAETDCVRVLVQVDGTGELAVWTGSNCQG